MGSNILLHGLLAFYQYGGGLPDCLLFTLFYAISQIGYLNGNARTFKGGPPSYFLKSAVARAPLILPQNGWKLSASEPPLSFSRTSSLEGQRHRVRRRSRGGGVGGGGGRLSGYLIESLYFLHDCLVELLSSTKGLLKYCTYLIT
jgi:hypothetical protein